MLVVVYIILYWIDRLVCRFDLFSLLMLVGVYVFKPCVSVTVCWLCLLRFGVLDLGSVSLVVLVDFAWVVLFLCNVFALVYYFRCLPCLCWELRLGVLYLLNDCLLTLNCGLLVLRYLVFFRLIVCYLFCFRFGLPGGFGWFSLCLCFSFCVVIV